MDYYIEDIVPHSLTCALEAFKQPNFTSPYEWVDVTNQILYYVYPIGMLLSLLSCLLSSIVTAKMAVDSHECYLTGFNVASFFLMLMTAVLQIPNYAKLDFSGVYSDDIMPYLPAVINWCWYSCTWFLLGAVIERTGHAMCGRWHETFGRVHGILGCLLILVVCFVSTLPQYWEYQVDEMHQYYDGFNCTRWVIAPKGNIIEQTGGYVIEYFVYKWVIMIFSIALPYLVTPILLPAMCCIKMHSYIALTRNGTISTYADDYTVKDDVRDERSFNRLLSAIVTVYLLLSGPRNTVRLLHNAPFFMSICADKYILQVLVTVFEILFYSVFIIIFFLCICMSNKFCLTLKSFSCKRNRATN